MPTGELPNIDDEVEETPEVESSTPEQTVPISRFNEVYKKTKDLEQEIGTLKTKGSEEQLTPEQQKERQAEDYLSKLTEKVLEKRETAKKEAEAKEQREFEGEVDDILAVHTDVPRDEFLKFIEKKSDEYGVKSVKGAMKLYKDLGKLKSETEEETKENLSRKPNLPKSEGTSSLKTPADDSGKSYEQIQQEVEREAEGKV